MENKGISNEPRLRLFKSYHIRRLCIPLPELWLICTTAISSVVTISDGINSIYMTLILI